MLTKQLTKELTKDMSTKLSTIDYDTSIYNLYIDYNSSTADQISGEAPLESYVDGGYLQTYGEYTVLNGMSNDISNAYWTKTAGITITGVDGFQADSLNDTLERGIATVEGSKYTLSFYASVELGGNTDNYLFRTFNSPEGNTISIGGLTETRKRYSKTVSGRVGGGTIFFGFMDQNSSNWAKVYIDTINVTQSNYPLPSVVNSTTSSLVVPSTNATSTTGPKYTLANMPKVIDALDGIADGVELVGNPITLDTGWVDNGDGTYTCDGTSGTLQIKGVLTLDAYYRSEFEIVEMTSGWIIPVFIGLSEGQRADEVGIHIDREVGTGGNPEVPMFYRSELFVGTIRPISVKQISPAQGELVVEWMPMFDWDDIPDINARNILSWRESDADLFAKNTGSLIFHDGTTWNCYKDIDFQANILYTIHGVWGTHPADGVGKMQIIITEGTTTWESAVVAFDGSFNPADFLSFGWENDYWQKIKSIKIYKEPQSW